MLARAVVTIGCLVAMAAAPVQPPTITKHLSLVTSVEKSGAALTLTLDVTPLPKMHVYAPGEKDGIPVSLTLDPSPAFKAGTIKLPPPQKYYFEPLQLTQLVFSKAFQVRQPITLTKPGEPAAITGRFRYQACDDRVCYLPVNVPVKWEIR